MLDSRIGAYLPTHTMVSQSKANIIFGHGSSVGRVREHNEDYHRVKTLPSPRGPVAFFAVADGMGGAAAGERASKSAIEVVSKAVAQYVEFINAGNAAIPFDKALEKAILAANRQINKEALENPQYSGMGTTLTVCVIMDRKLYYGHIGDSRGFLVRKGELKQFTRDHSWVQFQVEQGILTREEAENHPNRNQLMRALGTRAQVSVDVGVMNIMAGDLYFLSSDGLHGFVNEHELLSELSRTGVNLHDAIEYFIGLANARGGLDNITGVVAQVVS
jgi:PPM family protein phosphatase